MLCAHTAQICRQKDCAAQSMCYRLILPVSWLAHRAALLVVQQDVSTQAKVEQLLADLTESQLAVIAGILPKHGAWLGFQRDGEPGGQGWGK